MSNKLSFDLIDIIEKSIGIKKASMKIEAFLWGEQDSNLRRFPNGFTVRPRWPLEYLPMPF